MCDVGKHLFRATNVWWGCTQCFVIASCDYMTRDNSCVYMVHVCFMCVVGIVWGSVCCIVDVVEVF